MTQQENTQNRKLAYDADYSCLKKKFWHMKKTESEPVEEEIVDYDLYSDAEWMDDYDELRSDYL